LKVLDGNEQCESKKRNQHLPLHRVQTSELYDDEEQEDDDGEAGAEEVLPSRSEAHGSPGDEVRRGNKSSKPCFCTLLRHLQANSSTGRAAVSKTAGWGFEPLLACQPSPTQLRTTRVES